VAKSSIFSALLLLFLFIYLQVEFRETPSPPFLDRFVAGSDSDDEPSKGFRRRDGVGSNFGQSRSGKAGIASLGKRAGSNGWRADLVSISKDLLQK
jgi:hypothetical protein